MFSVVIDQGGNHRLWGWDENVVLRNSLPQVTQGSIVMGGTYSYVLVDQGGVCQGTVVHSMSNLA